MRYYETLYIVNPNYELERLDAVIKSVEKVLDNAKGLAVINHRTWGKKRLAYAIDKHKYGTYVLLQFELDSPESLLELDQFLKLEKAIIRYQTVRLESKPDVIEDAVDEPKEKAEDKKDDQKSDQESAVKEEHEKVEDKEPEGESKESEDAGESESESEPEPKSEEESEPESDSEPVEETAESDTEKE